jgi:hypothetical protein
MVKEHVHRFRVRRLVKERVILLSIMMAYGKGQPLFVQGKLGVYSILVAAGIQTNPFADGADIAGI